MPGRRNPRIRTLLLEASGPQEAEEQYAKRKRLSNPKAPRDPLGPLPQLPSRPAPHLKGSHVDQPPPNPIKFIRFGGGLPVEGGRPSIRRDRTQCTRGPRGTRRCPRVYPGTLGVYPGTLGVYPRTLGFTRGRSGIPGDARGIPGDARVYPGTLGYTRGRSCIPGDALCPRVCPGTIGFTRGRSGIPGTPASTRGRSGYTRGRSGTPGDARIYPGTTGYIRGPLGIPGDPRRTLCKSEIQPSWAGGGPIPAFLGPLWRVPGRGGARRPSDPRSIPYVSPLCLRAGNRSSGPDFDQILIGKASKSALRPAEGRPDINIVWCSFDSSGCSLMGMFPVQKAHQKLNARIGIMSETLNQHCQPYV